MGPLLLLKVSLLLTATLVTARLLGRAPATARHGLWSLAFGSLLLLAPLAAWLPALHVPVPAGWGSATPRLATFPGVELSAVGAGVTPPPILNPQSSILNPQSSVLNRASSWPSLSTLFFAAWLIGMLTAVVTVLLSLFRVRRLIRTAEVVSDPAWRSAAAILAAQLKLRHPVRLLSSPHVGTPMAGGVWRPAIFLPRSASKWHSERRNLVLAHELVHLAGRDPLRHLMTRLALACYWFHPLAWLAAREAAIAREEACDETVLSMGARPSVYARVLLDLAESLSATPRMRLLGALPMVHRSHLEQRLMAILNVRTRHTTRRLVAGPAICIALFTLSVAAARPALSGAEGPFAQGVASGVAGAVSSAPIQSARDRDSTCWSDDGSRGNFMGRTDSRSVAGRQVVFEQIGWRDNDRIIQKQFGDLRLCMLAEGAGDRNDDRMVDRPSQWIGSARRVVMEARRGNAVQSLELSGTRPTWRVGGATRDFDASAEAWRDRMLAVLDTTWEVATLQGQESALHGKISAIEGQRSALEGQISALQGAVSAMQGQISAAQGQESSLQGQISSIQGQVSSLQGAISAQQGAISSLSASRYGADGTERSRIAERIKEHDAEIARIERQIRDYDASSKIAAVERQISAFDARGKARAIEGDIRDFGLETKVAAIRRRIADLDVPGKVAGIERQIDALDVNRRVRQLEGRQDSELSRLNSAISAIR